MSTNMRRRSILKGMAGASLAAPLAQMFRPHLARAASAPVPKVVFFYVPTGLLPELWHPAEMGKTYNLKQLSAPLEAYKQDVIFMDGVTMFPNSDHQGGSLQLLAGDDKIQTTLDLQLGDFLMSQSPMTPFPTIQLGIQSRISKGGTPQVPHLHFTRRNGMEIFAEDNPLAAFDRYFAGVQSMPTDPSVSARLALQKRSILDNATADLKGLTSRLPGSERAKINSYTDSLRALEKRLTDPTTGRAACDVTGFNPTKFTVPAFGDPNSAAFNTSANKSVVGDLQMESARLALACGRTRVVTLVYEHTNARQPIPGLGAFGVHDASHYTAPPNSLTGQGTPAQVDAKLTAWNNYNIWYTQKFAAFIKMMKETPDPSGGSLFDNTIILHGSELGDGHAHKTQRIPYVFAGGSALGFKLGQALNYTGSVPALTSGPHANQKHISNSVLLTLVANKMGMPIPNGAKFFGYSGPQAVDPLGIGIV